MGGGFFEMNVKKIMAGGGLHNKFKIIGGVVHPLKKIIGGGVHPLTKIIAWGVKKSERSPPPLFFLE